MGQTSGFIYGNFRPYIDKQINIRQSILSKVERSPEDLLYLTGKTAWIKMTSAVDFDQNSALAKQYNLYGPDIAKQYQLFGGTLYRQKTIDSQGETKEFDLLRSGFGASQNKGINSNINYGLGGYKEAGFRPMPGIESATIKSKNQFGSLKEATVNFKCWNLEQLNILESLYMRPGYQVLLEWGHTIYYNNSNNLITGNKIKYIDFFDKSLTTPQQVLNQIENLKYSSGGNYDGLLGIVKNFSFTANNDGSYDCVTNLITWGEIVESLKISAAPLATTSKDSSNTSPLSGSINASRTQLEEYLKQIKILYNASDVSAGETIAQGDQIKAQEYVTSVENPSKNTYFQLDPDKDLGSFTQQTSEYQNIVDSWYKANLLFESKKLTTGQYNGEKDVYIPLARLLLAMNNINGIYGQNENNILPINYDIHHNKALTSPIQFSTDPKVCFYPADYKDLPNGERVKLFSNFYKLDPRNTGNPQVMNFMALAINVNYIISTLNSCIDEKILEINLLTFLQKLMNGISNAMGNYNKYDINVENNTVFIVDSQLIPLDYLSGASPSVIVLANQNSPNQSKKFGFCYSYNFTSRITNKIGATIAISAQANAQALNMDNVSFSKLNAGMKDRVNPYINDSTQRTQQSSTSTSNQKPNEAPEILIAKGFIALKDYYKKITKNIPESITDEEISTNQNFLKDILNKTKSKAEEGTIFIPIDLNISLEGIAGIRIGECFKIEDEKLPANYKLKNGQSKIKFLVRTLDHTISNNKWTTTLTALSVINSQGVKNSTQFNDAISKIIDPSVIYQIETIQPAVDAYVQQEAKKQADEQLKKDDPQAYIAKQSAAPLILPQGVGYQPATLPPQPAPYVSWEKYFEAHPELINQYQKDAAGNYLLGADGKPIKI